MIQKIDLFDLSVIFSVKVESKDRLKNFSLCLEYLLMHYANLEVIVIEQGTEPKLKSIIDQKEEVELRYHFIADTGPHYKTRNLNMASGMSSRPYVMINDCDIFCPPEAIREAMELLRADACFVSPHNGVMTEISKKLLDAKQSEELIENLTYFPRNFDDTLSEFEYADMYPIYGNKQYFSTGGCILYQKEAFYLIGGWNTNFVSYGYEDDEFVDRFKKLGYHHHTLDNYNLYHFQHERKSDSLMNNFAEANRLEWELVSSMEREELQQYAINGFKRIKFDTKYKLVRTNEERHFEEQLLNNDKLSLSELSVVIPVLMEDSWWMPPLISFIQYFSDHFSEYEIVLVEFKYRNSKYLPNREMLKYVYCEENYSLLTLKEKILEHASYSKIAIWDFFTMLDPRSIQSAIQGLNGSMQVVPDQEWYVKDRWKYRKGTGAILMSKEYVKSEGWLRAMQGNLDTIFPCKEADRLWEE